ncbi:uncharacterized protein LOC129739810 [Uranotaenia lowii]|uniref:uncharacterized protein LOC129739810 n=1 Tax=Uranotaenia lowii TaxID=190385 RepID=UPI00247A7214|nr:uncharacterized protein LOC129739810 [Uranotaenia lowii]
MDSASMMYTDSSLVCGESRDFKSCRLCCCPDQHELALIFPDGTDVGSNKLLIEKIYECTTVQIANEGVDRNALICQPCVAKIDDFYEYREQCKANDDRIRREASDHIDIKLEPKDISIADYHVPMEDNDDDKTESSSPVRLQAGPSSPLKKTKAGSSSNEVTCTTKETLSPEGRNLQNDIALIQLSDEITIKRETIIDDDNDVYYNSDGEAVDESQENSPEKTSSGPAETNSQSYRIIMTATNRERLIYNGFLYCRHFTRRDGSTHWRCRLGGCQAAVNLNLDNNIVPANTNSHNHPRNVPDELLLPDQMEKQSTDQSMKEKVDTETSIEPDMDQDQLEIGFSETEAVTIAADSIRIVPNKKGGETLIHLGFKYCKRYVRVDGSMYWKCRSNSNKCHAGLYVYSENKVRYHGEHNHDQVVEGDEDFDNENSADREDDLTHRFIIDEDVEEDGENQAYGDDIASLLEVMMPEDRRQSSQEYEITTNAKGRECLIHEGHQYSKDRERSDGASLWRCRRNYDKCRSLVIVHPNGRIESSGEHRHETDKRFLERQENGTGSRLFRITKNQRGNDALVFDGHRFSKEWCRVDGSIIWRCSYKSGMCRNKVVLYKDGLVHRMGAEPDHNHEQTEPSITEPYFPEEEVEFVDDALITPVKTSPAPKVWIPPHPSVHNSNFTVEQQTTGGYRITKNRKGFEALVYEGYRYCKIRIRQDGSIKWLCKMNKKTCRAAVDLFPDGSIAKIGDYEHNHEKPTDIDAPDEDDELEMVASTSSDKSTYPIDPEVFGNSQWYYVKNSKNGISMIHAGYRYTKKCERVDGTSLWRCSGAQRGCKAGVILFPNDTLAMVENAEHTHKPGEIAKSTGSGGVPGGRSSDVIEISEQDEDQAEDSEMNMHSLLQTVLGTGEVNWMGGEGDHDQSGVETVWYNSATDRPYPRPATGMPNFKIIKNRRNTDSLVYRGYRYCKMRDRVDGSILWACQMNKKTCKAAVNLTTDGLIEVLNGQHNHEQTDAYNPLSFSEVSTANTSKLSDTHVDLTLEEPTEETVVKNPISVPVKHPDYYFSINKNNRECLIHKGYRFRFQSDRPDGSSVWRCSMGGNTCMTVCTLLADGTPEIGSFKHNHQPLKELPPAVDRVTKPLPVVNTKAAETSDTQSSIFNRQGDQLEWNGFHYRKIKELPDNCIIWICQVDSCRVAVKMLPNKRLKMLSESEHNHTAAGQLKMPSSAANQIKPSTSVDASASGSGRSRSYRLFKNQRGQMTLLYQGYRYSIRNRNQDGSSSWKCRANASCGVVIYLLRDDRIVLGGGSKEHNHPPNFSSTKKLEAVQQSKVNPLYDYLNIVPGGHPQQNSEQSSEQQDTTKAVVSQIAHVPSSDSNYYGRNVIEHKGFYYKLVVRKKNGREYWRCVHFRTRSCRAALFCRDNGTVITSSNGKGHSHKLADAKPAPQVPPSNKPSSVSILDPLRTEVQPSPPDEVQLTAVDEERYIDHGDYVIAKNRKDQNTLIYKDRRYYLTYNRSDGSAVWRCAHRKRYKCYAYVRLRPDGRLLSTGDHEHSHSLTGEQTNSASIQKQPTKETLNYRIVKNRMGNDILLHDSHRFRLNYQRNDGTSHWRCIWARSNHCSAGVYVLANGSLKNAANEAQIIHNHPPPSVVKKAAAEAKALEQVVAQIPIKLEPQAENTDSIRTIPENEGITDYKFIEEGTNKILVCRGYRYWYTWIRKDGSIYYRCSEVKTQQCPMGILLLSNGNLIRANESCHNHDPTFNEHLEEEFLGFPSETQSQSQLVNAEEQQQLFENPPLNVPEDGDTDYKIVKTTRGETLLYKGYRYWAKNRLANGIVSLCCTRKKLKQCPAVLRLLPNSRIVDPIGAGHTHPPNNESALGPEWQVVGFSAPTIAKTSTSSSTVDTTSLTVVAKAKPSEPKLPPLSFNEDSDDDAESGDESIIGSRRYIFMKSTAQRNFIVFEGFVYDFEHKQHDGCVFYRCKSNEACPASLMLLTNGRVMNMDDTLHIHNKPDLSNFRHVGRGSKEFKIVQNKNGSNILVHRGHRYTTPRAKTDGAGIWYCHTYVPDLNRRCYVPIELLPNGRVAPVNDKNHYHSAPFKTKHESGETSSFIEPNTNDAKVDNKMLLLGGYRYNYCSKKEDGAVLWKCAKKTCNASMYRLNDGKIIKGADHNHQKDESGQPIATGSKRKFSEIDNEPKVSSPIVKKSHVKPTTSAKKTPRLGDCSDKRNPYIGQAIINDGFRYTYYLRKKDGTEYWRCCRRQVLKCRGGVYRHVDGSLVPANDEGHSHEPEYSAEINSVPETYTADDLYQDNDGTEQEPEVVEIPQVEEDGSYDYELIDVKGKKRGFYLIHKGAMFVSGHTRRDRARYYRCRTVGCKVAMMLLRNGLLVPSNEHTHDCQNAVKVGDTTDATVDEEQKDDDEQEDDETTATSPSSHKSKLLSEAMADEDSTTVTAQEEESVTNGSSASTNDTVVELKAEEC